MKKFKILLCCLVCSLCLSVPAFADSNDIKVYRAGYEYAMSNKPVIINDRLYMPLRDAFDAIDVSEIDWNAESRTIVATKNDMQVTMTIGGQEYSVKNGVNTNTFYMDAKPIIINDRAYVPIRYAVNGFGYDIEWDADTKSITLVGDFDFLGYGEDTPYKIRRTDQATIGEGACQFAMQFENSKVQSVTPSGAMSIDIIDSSGLNIYHIENSTFQPENYYDVDGVKTLFTNISLSSIAQANLSDGTIYVHVDTDNGISFDTTIAVSGLLTK